MAAVSAPAGLPTRSFSGFILGGLWPITPAETWSTMAQAERAFQQFSSAGANSVMASANALLGDNSGEMVEAMHVAYANDSKDIQIQADLYRVIADAVEECARLIESAKSQLETIDRQAHDQIQQAIENKGWFGPFALLAMIWAILARARADAQAVSASAAGKIGQQTGRDRSSEYALWGEFLRHRLRSRTFKQSVQTRPQVVGEVTD